MSFKMYFFIQIVCVSLYLPQSLFSQINFIFPEVVRPTESECVLIKQCPLAIKLLIFESYAPETIQFLRQSHCGFEGKEPKVWCNKLLDCRTPDFRTGKCINIKECEYFVRILENIDISKHGIKKYLRQFQCDDDASSDIRVCCPKEELLDNKIWSWGIKERFSHSLPDPEREECGKFNFDNKIVGGSTTNLDDFPWIVLLKYRNRQNTKFGCAGSLVNSRFVITAAHCVDQYVIDVKNLGKLFSVVLGEYDIRNETDCIYQKYGMDCADPPKEVLIDYVRSHPQYSSRTPMNDIALVRLKEEITFSDFIQPICLPSNSLTFTGNETFVVSGWGKTENGTFSPIKRKAQIPNVVKENCNVLNNNRNLTIGQICAGKGNGIDSCYGDSGGPLMWETKINKNFVTFLIGVVSYGYGKKCGVEPSVYTFIPNYIDWIVETIEEDEG